MSNNQGHMFTKEELDEIVRRAEAWFVTPEAKKELEAAFERNRINYDRLRKSMIVPKEMLSEPFTI